MNEVKSLQLTPGLKIANILFILLWSVVAAFPLLWILIMSFKLPLDAFATNPVQVILGFETLMERGGLSVLEIFSWAFAVYYFSRHSKKLAIKLLSFLQQQVTKWLAYVAFVLLALVSVSAFVVLVVNLINLLSWLLQWIPLINLLTEPVLGITTEHYQSVWWDKTFYDNFINSMIVTAGVVTISLSVGTLAGYALARSGSRLAFWLLIIALIFRALPHSVLVTGYLPVFVNSREFLMPLWESDITSWFVSLFSSEAPSLYGQPLPVIIVLVAINQPFTIWMLRSFFMNIPAELDEAARVDGCSYLKAFRLVIMPVMWPGVITAGLFSFLLAYNDYLVTALLLDNQWQTMVPAITQYFNRETTTTDEIEAVAAAVSIVIPLFFLVLAFQKQIVSGLTQGAVKG